MLTLTFQQLFEYLEKGEDDPFVEKMLEMDGSAKARLRQARLLFEFLQSDDSEYDSGSRLLQRSAVFDDAQSFSEDRAESVDYLSEDFLRGFVDESISEAEGAKTTDHAIREAERLMRIGSRELRVAGTLLIDTTSPGGATLYYLARRFPPKGASDSASLSADSAKPSVERFEKSFLVKDFKGPGYHEVPALFSKTRGKARFGESTRIRIGRLDLRCDVDAGVTELVLDIRNTEWRSPERQLNILYVPQTGKVVRTTTDLKGQTKMPMPTESGRLRLDSTPAIAIDIEIVK